MEQICVPTADENERLHVKKLLQSIPTWIENAC